MGFVFLRGVVVDVIGGLSEISLMSRPLSSFQNKVNIENLKAFPRNTIVIKKLTLGTSKTSADEIICYPFFSSHLSLPIKPGEQVWFVYENPDNPGPIAFWFSKVHEPSHVEDANYSFFTRSYRNETQKDKSTGSKWDKQTGAASEETKDDLNGLVSPTDNPKELLEIVQYTKGIHKFEAVPAYTKRMGDLVLQGSNNTLIMLGEERGHSSKNASAIINSANKLSQDDRSSAIDIVVGRGKTSSTSCTEIAGPLDVKMSDKRERKITEGDAHFQYDAARIYLTSNSNKFAAHNPDNLLSLMDPNNKSYPGVNYLPGTGSFAVMKADNLRLVARSSGLIKIVKEPDTNIKTNGAAIVLHEDGIAQISGAKVLLSSYFSEENLQPYVLHDGLVDILVQILSPLITLGTTMLPAMNAIAAMFPPAQPLAQAANDMSIKFTAMIAQLQAKQAQINSTVVFGQ
jgi:hypothetical protein